MSSQDVSNWQKRLVRLENACRAAKDLYDHMALGTLEAAVKYGDNYEPPTDEDCLKVRAQLEEALTPTPLKGN